MTEEERKEMMRKNYASQMDALGYNLDGSKTYSKTEEPVKATHTDEWHWYCGKCGCRIPLKIKAHYCHKCGTPIDWIDRKELRHERIFAS